MIERIADKENLIAQTIKLKEKNFKPGIDNMTADAARVWLEINGDRLCRELINGTYAPMPAVGFRTAKKNGKFRQLSKLTALDTVIQYEILECLNEIYEPVFSEFSFAFRPGKGVGAAVSLYQTLAAQYRYAAKFDPKACFDNIDRELLIKILSEIINDKKFVAVIKKFTDMPIMVDNEIRESSIGIIQGSPISPILCNIYLDKLDKYLEKRGITFIRYADDLVIFGKDYDDVVTCDALAYAFIKTELKLEKNAAKCRIDSPVNLTFLGYKFKTDKKGMIALEAESSLKSAYHYWYESKPVNNRRRYDIISDGILRQKDYSLIFESDIGKRNIPVETTDVINIYSNVIFDSGFLEKALSFGIEINIFSKSSHKIGTFTPVSPLKSPSTTFEQLTAYYNESKRLELSENFVLSSIHNIRLNIRYYNKQENKAEYDDALKKLDKVVARIRNCDKYEKLLLLEANSKEIYFSCFDSFISKSEFRFEKRTRRPPRNEINAMISFGNTVLYSLIATEINKTNLDVRIGYLHATNRRQESLNLDIADVFRPLIVDRTVFKLANKNMIKPEHFKVVENGGVYLTDDGMHIFLTEFYDKLDTALTIDDKKVSYYQIIRNEIDSLVRYMRTGEKYIPFRQVR